MAARFSPRLLRSLRNDVPIGWLLDVLDLPVKISDGYLRFRCPRCAEFHTATNSATNLARCFRCRENFNPIELVMLVRKLNFLDAVNLLLDLRAAAPPPPSASPPSPSSSH